MEWLSNIFVITKVPAKWFVILAIVSGMLLWLPLAALKQLHLEAISDSYGSFMGVVFVVSSSVVAVNVAIWGNGCRKQRCQIARHEMDIATELANLAPDELTVLRRFRISGRATIEMSITQPVVAGLINRGILYQASYIGCSMFSITPTAKKLLKW